MFSPGLSRSRVLVHQGARQGHGFSQIFLGNLYENGWGVAQDTTQSRELYQLAAGNPNPQIAELGRQSPSGQPIE
jgi:TPR repeat protein